MRTRRELIDLVLDKLGILVPGQAPDDESVDRVDNVVDPAFAKLAALGAVYVADPGEPSPPTGGEIDDALFLSLADYVAWQCAGGFNQADNIALKTLSDQAVEDLRIIGRPASTRRELVTDRQLGGSHGVPGGNFTTGT